MNAAQIVSIVFAVIASLCSLHQCMSAVSECQEEVSCSDLCCCARTCKNTSRIEFGKAVEEAPHEVKRLALAACDDTNGRFKSYEGEFRGQYGLT